MTSRSQIIPCHTLKKYHTHTSACMSRTKDPTKSFVVTPHLVFVCEIRLEAGSLSLNDNVLLHVLESAVRHPKLCCSQSNSLPFIEWQFFQGLLHFFRVPFPLWLAVVSFVLGIFLVKHTLTLGFTANSKVCHRPLARPEVYGNKFHVSGLYCPESGHVDKH